MPALCIILLVFISSPFVSAQTEIRLTPGLGVQALQSYVKDDMNANEEFGPYNFVFTTTYSISLQAKIQDNWQFLAGLKSFKSSIAYKSGKGEHGARVNGGGNCSSFLLGVDKKIGTHKWLKINPQKKAKGNGEHYLFLFKSKIVSGVSHEWGDFSGSQVFRDTNTSIFFGLALQFFDWKKDRLQLSFVYSHGLKEIAEWEINYIKDNNGYSGTVGTKGSFFSIQLAYPIRLATTLKRKA